MFQDASSRGDSLAKAMAQQLEANRENAGLEEIPSQKLRFRPMSSRFRIYVSETIYSGSESMIARFRNYIEQARKYVLSAYGNGGE